MKLMKVEKELHPIKLRLIKKELPKNINSPAGLHKAKYYVQYISLDGFILLEREANSFDLNVLFRDLKQVDDIQE